MSKTPKSSFSLQNSSFRFQFFFDQNLDFVLGFVKFANLEDAHKFRETVHGNVYKKKKVFVKDCITSAEIQEKKRKREEELGLTGNKKQKTGPATIRDMLNNKLDRGMHRPLPDKVSPLHKMEYSEQLKLKWRHIKSTMRCARKDLVYRCKKENTEPPKWAVTSKKKVEEKIEISSQLMNLKKLINFMSESFNEFKN